MPVPQLPVHDEETPTANAANGQNVECALLNQRQMPISLNKLKRFANSQWEQIANSHHRHADPPCRRSPVPNSKLDYRRLWYNIWSKSSNSMCSSARFVKICVSFRRLISYLGSEIYVGFSNGELMRFALRAGDPIPVSSSPSLPDHQLTLAPARVVHHLVSSECTWRKAN